MGQRNAKSPAASISHIKPNHLVGQPMLVPPGLYRLAYKRMALVKRFDRGVLELWFTIADLGPFFELEVPRYYNVSFGNKRNQFSARPQSDFVLEYCSLFGQRPKFERSPLGAFETHLVEGLIQSVTKNHRQKAIPEPARYSTIRELRRVM